MKEKIFEYFDNSTEVSKAVLDGLLDEIIANTTGEAYADGYEKGYDKGLEEGYTNGYEGAYQEVAANENLKPENIRKGVELFGVIGTYEGEPTEDPIEE